MTAISASPPSLLPPPLYPRRLLWRRFLALFRAQKNPTMAAGMATTRPTLLAMTTSVTPAVEAAATQPKARLEQGKGETEKTPAASTGRARTAVLPWHPGTHPPRHQRREQRLHTAQQQQRFNRT